MRSWITQADLFQHEAVPAKVARWTGHNEIGHARFSAARMDDNVIVLQPQRLQPAMLFRWVVERTFAWLNRNRRLAKDFEHMVESATAWLFLAFVQLITRRIARV